jgi:hypothetical protein
MLTIVLLIVIYTMTTSFDRELRLMRSTFSWREFQQKLDEFCITVLQYRREQREKANQARQARIAAHLQARRQAARLVGGDLTDADSGDEADDEADDESDD